MADTEFGKDGDMKHWPIIAMLSATLVVGCTNEEEPSGSGTAPAGGTQSSSQAAVQRPAVPQETLALGREVFTANCAACHGSEGQGAPNWQKPGPDGKYPAPPLNGTGHAWHHPMAALKQTISHGTLRIGGSMPPWKDQLSEQEIQAVIYWFQSQWPNELYAAWQEADRRSQTERN